METFDYIVVGGGSAGCVLASRLSEDPDNSVCLLETGGAGTNPLIRMPLGLGAILPLGPSKLNRWHNYHYRTVPQSGLNGRRGYQPRGRGTGWIISDERDVVHSRASIRL